MRELAAVGGALQRTLSERCALLRFDLPWEYEVAAAAGGGVSPADAAVRDRAWSRSAAEAGLRVSAAEIQPRATVLIDLRPDEGALLAAMKSKWRYNVRLAHRRGVTVQAAGIERIAEWYALFRETAARDRIAIHAEEYYRAAFEESEHAPDGPRLELLLAHHEHDLLAGIVVAYHRRRATYLYGASAELKRSVMPAYALQWEAIRRARRAGMLEYDLFGIPRFADERHRMFGLYRFKTGFGGRIVERPGCVDLPLQPIRYGVFRSGEAARAALARFRKRGRTYSGSGVGGTG